MELRGSGDLTLPVFYAAEQGVSKWQQGDLHVCLEGAGAPLHCPPLDARAPAHPVQTRRHKRLNNLEESEKKKNFVNPFREEKSLKLTVSNWQIVCKTFSDSPFPCVKLNQIDIENWVGSRTKLFIIGSIQNCIKAY